MSKSQITNDEPTWEQIAQRAYEIYLDEGRPEGHAEEHWALAQNQLKNKFDVKVMDQKQKRSAIRKNPSTVLQP